MMRSVHVEIQRTRLALHCVALLAFFSCGITSAQDVKTPAGQRVFYTGHSFHMFVPPQVEQLVKAAGIQNHKLAGTQGIGGSRVIQHWDLADDKNKAKSALAGGEVDVFTMAAHLQIPDDGITKFTELGLKHNPNLRLLVQASWYPFDVPRAHQDSSRTTLSATTPRSKTCNQHWRNGGRGWKAKLTTSTSNMARKRCSSSPSAEPS